MPLIRFLYDAKSKTTNYYVVVQPLRKLHMVDNYNNKIDR